MYCLIFQPPPGQICRVSKDSPQCLRQEFLSSECRGEQEWTSELDLRCSAWLRVLNIVHSLHWGQWRAAAGLTNIWHAAAVVGAGAGEKEADAHLMGDGASHTHCSGQARARGSCCSPGNGRVNEEGRQTVWKYNTGKLFPCFFGTFQNSLIKKVYGKRTPLKNYSFKYLQKQLSYITNQYTVYEQTPPWKHLWTPVPALFNSTRRAHTFPGLYHPPRVSVILQYVRWENQRFPTRLSF